MISHIDIRDFALIHRLSLDFYQGFHVITGETGAGKSILIEAVSLALGSRADTSFVRTGCEKAVIELTADTENPEIIALLRENGIETAQPMVFTREIFASGKSVCRINGTMVSVTFLNTLCRKLADIHGQYDHQSLLNPERHMDLLDRYGEGMVGEEKARTAELFRAYIKTKRELSELRKNAAERERQRDFMQFEWQEIDGAALSEGEDEELESRLLVLQNGERIYESLSRAYELFSEGETPCVDMLGRGLACLREAESFSADAAAISRDVESSYYALKDAASEIRRLRDDMTFSQEELDQTQERLDVINRLKRKYGGSLEEVFAYKERLERDLELTESSEALQKELAGTLKKYKEGLLASSRRLSDLRKEAAKRIEERVNAELEELNFKDAEFRVHFGQKEGEIVLTEYGMDQIEFLIRSNKGETLKPLAKVASGGEISRIMLALKTAIGDCDRIPTLIFDEIDTGISGIAASVVGRKLRSIAENHQVICITHLAQIAAFGAHHYRIEKNEEKERTATTVTLLDKEETVREIARLLGGMNITETTLESARELLSFSEK